MPRDDRRRQRPGPLALLGERGRRHRARGGGEPRGARAGRAGGPRPRRDDAGAALAERVHEHALVVAVAAAARARLLRLLAELGAVQRAAAGPRSLHADAPATPVVAPTALP